MIGTPGPQAQMVTHHPLARRACNFSVFSGLDTSRSAGGLGGGTQLVWTHETTVDRWYLKLEAIHPVSSPG